MAQIDRRVDAYIAHAAPFAQPILERLREDVHAACPDAEEAIKWSMPFFMHAGRNLAHMAAFKAHCAFGFELGRAVVDLGREAQAMGQFGRITKLDDLPDRAEVRRLVKKAAAMIDAGARAPRAPKSGNGAAAQPLMANAPAVRYRVVVPPLPPALAKALAANAAARRGFDALPPGQRRDLVVSITEAKREDTRQRRVAQALVRLVAVQGQAQGRTRISPAR